MGGYYTKWNSLDHISRVEYIINYIIIYAFIHESNLALIREIKATPHSFLRAHLIFIMSRRMYKEKICGSLIILSFALYLKGQDYEKKNKLD